MDEISQERSVRDVNKEAAQKQANHQVQEKLRVMEDEPRQNSMNPLGQGTKYMGSNKKYLSETPTRAHKQKSDVTQSQLFTASPNDGRQEFQRGITGISGIDSVPNSPIKLHKKSTGIFKSQKTQGNVTLTKIASALSAKAKSDRSNISNFDEQTPVLGKKSARQSTYQQ